MMPIAQFKYHLHLIVIITLLSFLIVIPVFATSHDDSEDQAGALKEGRIVIAQSEGEEESDEEEGEEEGEEEDEGGDEEENTLGKELYDAYCARCHGFEGDGQGEASNFTDPKPRDFTSGMYKFRSTPSGEPPTDNDIVQIILKGVPGTSMFGWEGKFNKDELDAMVQYIKDFDPETFEFEGEPIEIGTPPPVSEKLMAIGAELYENAKCWECHGKFGRGDGVKGWQPNFKDDWGDKIWPTNLDHPWELRNGASLNDLYRSISTGLDGTPMPSFADSYSEEQRWGLTYYIKSLQLERKLNNILVLDKVDTLPTSTEDHIWDTANRIDTKMEGKKVFGIPFISAITNMRIRGLYTSATVSIMLEWIDKKPDKGDDELPPDAVQLIFPVKRNLLNVWYWKASDNLAIEFNASGQTMNALTRQKKTDVQAKSNYKDGIYKVMFTRNMITRDKNDTRFSVNKRIPFSIVAYDGKNREQGNRGSLSAVRYMIIK